MKLIANSAAVALAAAGVMVGLGLPSASAAPVFAVAPYVDMTGSTESLLDEAIRGAGVNSYTAAFLTGVGCRPIWGDTLGIDDSTVNPLIARAQSAGAQTIIAFGGAAGLDLSNTCSDMTQLVAAYQSVINKYRVNHLDFDIEGPAIEDSAANVRRGNAIKTLQSRNSGLVVSLTIPVLESGPIASGDAFLQQTASTGARIDIVNAMTMDYGHTVANMEAAAETAAQGTLNSGRRAFGSGFSFRNVGITPMIGQNDSANEEFTTTNAEDLVRFANRNGVGRLAFWSIGRDVSCSGGITTAASPTCSGTSQTKLQFARTFTGFSGNPPPPGPPPPPPPPPGPPPPPPPGGNLALNKPATGSTPCNANEGPAKAVNGSVSGGNSDKWCSQVSGTKFLQVDLGSAMSIGSFTVRHAQAGGESSAFNTRDYDIRVSTDGSTFSTAVQVRGNTSGVTTNTVNNVRARFVRLNVITPTQNGNAAARIYEFEMRASGTNPPPPPPGPPPPPPPPGGTWAPNVAYHIGDVVTFQGSSFRCIQAHTSQVGWEPPNVPALWQRI